jgi:hypothetical protein
MICHFLANCLFIFRTANIFQKNKTINTKIKYFETDFSCPAFYLNKAIQLSLNYLFVKTPTPKAELPVVPAKPLAYTV